MSQQQPLRPNARWTNEELLLAVQGVRRHGKDFKAIAEIVGNKTEAHVRSFYINNERRFNLNEMLREYEAEYGDNENEDQSEPKEKTKKVRTDDTPATPS